MPDPARLAVYVSIAVALVAFVGWAIDVSFESGILEGRVTALENTVNAMRDVLLRLMQGHAPPFDVPGM